MIPKIKHFQHNDTATINGKRITPRELDLITLMGEGLADKEMAHQLGTSIHTVIKQLANMRHKLKATSKYHLVALAAKAGML